MIIQRFTQQYVIALSLVAGLTIVGQLLVQRQINNLTGDSYLASYAGKQRSKSQQIVKDALLLTNSDGLTTNRDVARDLQKVLISWEQDHSALKIKQLTKFTAPIHNTESLNLLFANLEPDYQAISRAANLLLAETAHPTGLSAAKRRHLQEILNHDIAFLNQMEAIARQYEREAAAKLEQLYSIAQTLTTIILVVLLLAALLIFQPAVRTFRKTVRQLTLSEYQTRLINEDLHKSHQSVKQAQTQLMREANLRYQQRLNEQRIRMSSVVQGQEEERKRLSRDLHDGIGQMLTGLKLLAENIRSTSQLSEKDQVTFSNLKSLLIRTIQETRNVSNNLMPPVLGDFGLVSALRQLIDQQDKQSSTSVTLHTSLTNERFGQPIEIGLYRIVQEAVNNAIKHAGATDIDVSLEQRQDRLFLRITNDGVIKTSLKRSMAQGLHNMRERTRLLDGKFRLTTRPDRRSVNEHRPGNLRYRLIRLDSANSVRSGTRLLVSIPIVEQPVYNVATRMIAA
ncbi:sensor histidine kinase [Spirosoma utsteinense]|uniref:histidine kinase n=1 Tax=Spirosoma utsteinense TaxID=2585773 RepID=A0ABR6W0G2_9BACT|nr:sensor histidine kinase [Spirosoma utsteinense]MBC3783755.1 signal transduction histidine kinase [Spirosoma utsteinense]MBC3790101.1 signal transduction histidine kinase [Spirosoma utsteinense]